MVVVSVAVIVTGAVMFTGMFNLQFMYIVDSDNPHWRRSHSDSVHLISFRRLVPLNNVSCAPSGMSGMVRVRVTATATVTVRLRLRLGYG